MVERDYGYIAATFSQDGKKPFEKLTEKLCEEGDLFHSDSVSDIDGNVSSDLHLTIFYGLVDEGIDKDKLQAHIEGLHLDTLKLGSLFLRQTPDNKYQILWVTVVDDDSQLKELSESFKNFEHDNSVQLEFMPHLTLAYVNSEYTLPDPIPEYPKEIKVEQVKYFEK